MLGRPVVRAATLIAAMVGSGGLAGTTLGQTPGPYRLTDLGALGGRTSTALAINARGQIVGDTEVTRGLRSAFLWNPVSDNAATGTMRSIAVSWSISSSATAVNDSGQGVGWAYSSALTDIPSAIGWQGMLVAALPSAPPYTNSLSATGITNAGLIVGNGLSGGTTVPYTMYGPIMTALPLTPGAVGAYAAGVNESGTVVGMQFFGPGISEACVWRNGSVTMLGKLGGTISEAKAINDSGVVVGQSRTAGEHNRAFMYQSGTMFELPGLGGTESGALGLNGLGVVVGYARTGNTPPPGARANALRAVVWVGGMVYDLNSLLPAGSGWDLMQAYAINDAGQIVGRGRTPQGRIQAFLLTPGTDPGPPACAADVNGDGVVNTADITAFLNAWFQARASGTLGRADFNGDGVVNTADITAFLNAWFRARAGGGCGTGPGGSLGGATGGSSADVEGTDMGSVIPSIGL